MLALKVENKNMQSLSFIDPWFHSSVNNYNKFSFTFYLNVNLCYIIFLDRRTNYIEK